MKTLVVLVLLLTGCAVLDNSGKHKPIYMTDERYAHYAQGNFSEPAPWPY